MSEMTISTIRARPVASAAIAIAAVGAVTILGALILQYGFGLQPCPLCLEQRYAYYLALPLAAFIAFCASRRPRGESDRGNPPPKTMLAASGAIATCSQK